MWCLFLISPSFGTSGRLCFVIMTFPGYIHIFFLLIFVSFLGSCPCSYSISILNCRKKKYCHVRHSKLQQAIVFLFCFRENNASFTPR